MKVEGLLVLMELVWLLLLVLCLDLGASRGTRLKQFQHPAQVEQGVENAPRALACPWLGAAGETVGK